MNIKFNGGKGALLCDWCSRITCTGADADVAGVSWDKNSLKRDAEKMSRHYRIVGGECLCLYCASKKEKHGEAQKGK